MFFGNPKSENGKTAQDIISLVRYFQPIRAPHSAAIASSGSPKADPETVCHRAGGWVVTACRCSAGTTVIQDFGEDRMGQHMDPAEGVAVRGRMAASRKSTRSLQ